MNKKLYDALAAVVYLNSMTLNGKTVSTDDQKIRVSSLYSDWTPGKHTVGQIFNTHQAGGLGPEWEQTWECFQAYDNAVYPDISPGNSAWYTFNRPLHGKTAATARPFVPVQGSHDIYRLGEFMVWTDGHIYECVAPNGTNFSPSDYPDHWVRGE